MYLLLLVVLVLLFIYIYIKYKYLRLCGSLPGLSPNIFFGNLLESGILLNGATTCDVFRLLKDRFGNVFEYWFGLTRIIVISDIEDVQYIFSNRHKYEHGQIYREKFGLIFPKTLISLTGDAYKRHASLIRPIFHRSKVVCHNEIIVNCVDQLLAKWRMNSSNKIHLDIVHQSQNVLIEIFGLIAFNYHLKTLDEPLIGRRDDLTESIRIVLNVVGKVIHMPTFLLRIYLKFNWKYLQAQSIIKERCNEVINHQLKELSHSNIEGNKSSFITSLVSSLQEDEKIEEMKNEGEKRGLSRDELIEELMIFLVAGTDTSSTTLSWFIYYMSKYPKVQEKIKSLLINISPEKRMLSLDDLNSLVYIDAVLKEVLRLSPPFDGTFRTLKCDDYLPHSGVKLYQGDQIYISLNNLSQDIEHWSIDPQLFYPERYLKEDKYHNPYAWIPFGGGHRQCMGQHLALFQLKVIIARLMQHVTFIDAGSKLNAGGKRAKFSIFPKHIGVKIIFDNKID